MGNIVKLPALFDMHVHLREPGQTHKEDIESGCAAAFAGGFDGVACMPNTSPPIDVPELVSYVIDKAKSVGFEVYPVACITKGMEGKELTDFSALKKAGAVAVSDDGRPVENAEIMRAALVEAYKVDLPIISHCEDLKIINGGVINKGEVSEKLGLNGMDRISEDSVTEREILLAEETRTRIHIAHVSTAGSVELVRQAKKRGVMVTCETCPHYFTLTEDVFLKELNAAKFRMNPPLRTENDRKAVIEGVLDGTIDCIVTDHAPHTLADKGIRGDSGRGINADKGGFINAPNGVIGLETSLAATLTAFYHTRLLTLDKIAELMSINPRKILNLPQTKNIIEIDIDREWIVNVNEFKSKARNCVFDGMILKGKVTRKWTH